MQKLRNVVFDVGRVLVEFSFEPFRSFLVEHGAHVHTTADFIEQSRLLDYEHGRISSGEFINTVNTLLETPASLEELCGRWKAIFTPIPEMIDLLSRLRPQYRVYLLSNSNALHWEFLEDEYGLEGKTDGAIVSFRVGAMKPDPAIYAHAEEHYGLKPSETVFMDDLQSNVDGALARGWSAFQYVSPDKALNSLASLGVSLE